jgi:hypothetical protein
MVVVSKESNPKMKWKENRGADHLNRIKRKRIPNDVRPHFIKKKITDDYSFRARDVGIVDLFTTQFFTPSLIN